MAVNRYTEANVFHLANELAQGHKVIIGVDSSKLWGQNPTMDSLLDTIRGHFQLAGSADHAVVVSGIDTTDPHHVRVIISDPGDGKAVASYPLEKFLDAWEGSHFFMVATQDSAPNHVPEMVHFDYAAGHIEAIADVPYEQFVEQFADQPEALACCAEHYADEHALDIDAPDFHEMPWDHQLDSTGHDYHEHDFHEDHHSDDHHGAHDLGDHHGDDIPGHDDPGSHYHDSSQLDDHAAHDHFDSF